MKLVIFAVLAIATGITSTLHKPDDIPIDWGNLPVDWTTIYFKVRALEPLAPPGAIA